MAKVAVLHGNARERALSWFPWLADNYTSLDRPLVKHITSSPRTILTTSDITLLLRWFSNVPEGFLSEEDFKVANWLSERLPSNLAV